MPTPEAKHERATRITAEAAAIACRERRTQAELARIYEREVARLLADEPGRDAPASEAAAQPRLPVPVLRRRNHTRRATTRMTQLVSSS